MTDDLLTIWVIYHSPSDFPGKWVLRGQDALPGRVVRPHANGFICETLEQARKHVPPGLAMLTRHPDDDPVIYEVWL
jgi:hypothetical protein